MVVQLNNREADWHDEVDVSSGEATTQEKAEGEKRRD